VPETSNRDRILANLDEEEREEVGRYIAIFEAQGLREHWQVNDWIGENDSWDNFPRMRSRNHHQSGAVVDGITPRHFSIVCQLLEIGPDDGSKLVHYEKY